MGKKTNDDVCLHEFVVEIMNERQKGDREFREERELRYAEKFAAYKSYSEQVEISTKDASEKALASVDRRLEQMNEFRESVNDVVHTMMPRYEYESKHQSLETTLDTYTISQEKSHQNLIERVDEKMGNMNNRIDSINKWLVGLLGGLIVALILAIVDILIRTI